MVNKLILGTVQFGLNYGINNSSGKPDRNSVYAILDHAFEKGIRLLDSAEAYGDAHEVIGSYHNSSPNRFQLITKYSSARKDLPQELDERVKKDLEVLKCDSLYAYMFHSFKDFDAYYSAFEPAIRSLKKAGIIKRLGVSVYTNAEFEQLLDKQEVDLVQLPFNLLDNSFQRTSLIDKAKHKGMEVHTRSAFLQGLFFKKEDQLPEKLKALAPYLKKINSISTANEVQIGDLALNYAVQQKNIDRVLIGVETLEQLNANIASLNKPLTVDVMHEMNELRVMETDLLNPSNWN